MNPTQRIVSASRFKSGSLFLSVAVVSVRFRLQCFAISNVSRPILPKLLWFHYNPIVLLESHPRLWPKHMEIAVWLLWRANGDRIWDHARAYIQKAFSGCVQHSVGPSLWLTAVQPGYTGLPLASVLSHSLEKLPLQRVRAKQSLFVFIGCKTKVHIILFHVPLGKGLPCNLNHYNTMIYFLRNPRDMLDCVIRHCTGLTLHIDHKEYNFVSEWYSVYFLGRLMRHSRWCFRRGRTRSYFM